MQLQLIPETTMHAFDINTLLTMIAINKLTDRTGANPKKFQGQTNLIVSFSGTATCVFLLLH
jgi:hypothetical protein